MLKGFRERTKMILWIVVLTFIISIFALWGMDLRTPDNPKYSQNVAGTVNKDEIPYGAYENTLNQLWAQARQQRGEEYQPSDIERNMLSDQAWELTVQARLMERQVQDLRLTVSDDELVSFLRKNPHPQLVQTFTKEDGTFDYQEYLKALNNPEVDWTELERWGRGVIPEVKLQTMLVAQVHIPERDVLERFKAQNVTTKARYVEIPIPTEEPPYEPSDADIKAQYEKSREDFTDPPMRRVRVVEVEKKPTAADDEDAAARLADLRTDIVEGTLDFAKAAQEYSDDEATAAAGGELGFVARGARGAEFDAVAFALKPGEISAPFRTQLGYHIVQVQERKTENGVEKVKARQILMKVELGTDSMDSLTAYVRDLSTEIRKEGLEKAAAARKLKTFDSEPFSDGMFIKDLGFVPRIVNFAFNNKVGSVSYGIETPASVYFVKILEETPERVKPLEEVRSRLVDELRRAHAAAAARAKADAVRRDMIANGFEAGAKAHGLFVKVTPAFKQGDQIPEIGTNSAFATACSFLALNAVSPPIEMPGRFFIISVVERTEPDLTAYGEARKTIVEEMRNESASRFLANWYQGIRERAKVVDLRDKPLD